MNCIKGECFQSSVGTEAYHFVVNIHYTVLKENIFCSEILASNYLAYISKLFAWFKPMWIFNLDCCNINATDANKENAIENST